MASGLRCFGLVALAVVEQGAERHWVITTLSWPIGIIAFVALSALVAISARIAPVGLVATLSADFAWVVAGGSLLLGLIPVVPAWFRLHHMRRQWFTAGSSLLVGIQGAAFALDSALIRDILVDDQTQRRGHVRLTRGPGSGVWTIALRDLQRLWRAPRPLVSWLVSMAAPYAVHALGVEVLNPSISALVLITALIGFCNILRVLIRIKGLQRRLPFSPGEVKQAAMAAPVLLVLLWAVAVTPAFGGVFGGGELNLVTEFLTSFIATLGGLLATLRWVCTKPPNYGDLVVPVGIGAMPPGMMFSFIRGIDIVALITLPLTLGQLSWVSLIVATVTWLVLCPGLNQQAPMDEREEQQRLLAEQKSGCSGRDRGSQKVRVQRKRWSRGTHRRADIPSQLSVHQADVGQAERRARIATLPEVSQDLCLKRTRSLVGRMLEEGAVCTPVAWRIGSQYGFMAHGLTAQGGIVMTVEPDEDCMLSALPAGVGTAVWMDLARHSHDVVLSVITASAHLLGEFVLLPNTVVARLPAEDQLPGRVAELARISGARAGLVTTDWILVYGHGGVTPIPWEDLANVRAEGTKAWCDDFEAHGVMAPWGRPALRQACRTVIEGRIPGRVSLRPNVSGLCGYVLDKVFYIDVDRPGITLTYVREYETVTVFAGFEAPPSTLSVSTAQVTRPVGDSGPIHSQRRV